MKKFQCKHQPATASNITTTLLPGAPHQAGLSRLSGKFRAKAGQNPRRRFAEHVLFIRESISA